jgi:hypothetical protein
MRKVYQVVIKYRKCCMSLNSRELELIEGLLEKNGIPRNVPFRTRNRNYQD